MPPILRSMTCWYCSSVASAIEVRPYIEPAFVDQDVETAEMGRGAVDKVGRRRAVRDVRRENLCRTAGRAHGGGNRFGPGAIGIVVDGEVHAELAELLRHRRADAGTGPHDQAPLAPQIRSHLQSPFARIRGSERHQIAHVVKLSCFRKCTVDLRNGAKNPEISNIFADGEFFLLHPRIRKA